MYAYTCIRKHVCMHMYACTCMSAHVCVHFFACIVLCVGLSVYCVLCVEYRFDFTTFVVFIQDRTHANFFQSLPMWVLRAMMCVACWTLLEFHPFSAQHTGKDTRQNFSRPSSVYMYAYTYMRRHICVHMYRYACTCMRTHVYVHWVVCWAPS